uniref:Uncharacterized protein n=1 Tax=Timema douglasi TaxID=61478 RepID=A0A7R8ZCV0_TIMDO|nr:unnamed protein product [Timema douglasi]
MAKASLARDVAAVARGETLSCLWEGVDRTAKSGLLKEIYDSNMDHDANNHPGSLIEGLRKVCAMEHYAYITTYELSFPLLNMLDCRLVCLPEVFSKVRHSILLTKHSPYRKAINHVIQKLKESGVLNNIKLKTMGIAVAQPHLKEDVISGVELWDVYCVFHILISGAIVSVIILAAENIYHLHNGDKRKSLCLILLVQHIPRARNSCNLHIASYQLDDPGYKGSSTNSQIYCVFCVAEFYWCLAVTNLLKQDHLPCCVHY